MAAGVVVAVALWTLTTPTGARAPMGQFTLGDGFVLDEGTRLWWQDPVIESAMTWVDALAYCEDLELAGFDDWRLPTAKELQTIVDDATAAPAIDTRVFRSGLGIFWTSTPVAALSETSPWVWMVDFYWGRPTAAELPGEGQARCVR
jgi:hypothetical protein